MDFILAQIQEQRNLLHLSPDNRREELELYRLEVEYAYIFLLAYLWNRNFNRISADDRESILRKIVRPTFGTIAEICRTLDIDNQLNRQLRKSMQSYPNLRNKNIGHGYIFGKALAEVLDQFKNLSVELFRTSNSLLTDKFDLVLVTDEDTNQNGRRYIGRKFDLQSNRIVPWACHAETFQFHKDNVYCMKGINDYSRLSPFIDITRDREFYIFVDIADPLIGRAEYNQVLKSRKLYREWPEFLDDISSDGARRKSRNGTVRNVYDNNYNAYIDIGIGMKREIKNFILKNQASVSVTIWGHGGVGKTATVQRVCEELSEDRDRSVDYIVFASAKDRTFSYRTGGIVDIDEPIDSYSSLIRCVSSTIGNLSTHDDDRIADGIIQFQGRVLIVIDDYETFPQAEKSHIERFIEKLDINRHKVVITTRANVSIGHAINTHELSPDETTRFLIEVIRNEFPEFINQAEAKLIDGSGRAQEDVYEVTTGRPLFIFQFAHIWMQAGELENATQHNIKDKTEAVEFLYGRIYDYLSPNGKLLFRAIGRLVDEEDLSNLIDKLKYIVNMENDNSGFNQGLEDLVKLRIIERSENRFFSVYSSEVLKIMRQEFDRSTSSWKGSVNARILQVSTDKNLDNEHALLTNANRARLSRTEKEVVDLYRQILNRSKSPREVQVQAIKNVTDYLFNYRGNRDESIRIFQDYLLEFRTEPSVIKMYANYCWATGRRTDAIEILLELINSKDVSWKSSGMEFEMLGLCLTYRSIEAIDRKDRLKTRFKQQEINHKEFISSNNEVKQEFRIIRHAVFGFQLFERIRKEDIRQLSKAARQNVFTGLLQLSEVCLRQNSRNEAREICIFGVKESPIPEQFQRKLTRLDDYSRDMTPLAPKLTPRSPITRPVPPSPPIPTLTPNQDKQGGTVSATNRSITDKDSIVNEVQKESSTVAKARFKDGGEDLGRQSSEARAIAPVEVNGDDVPDNPTVGTCDSSRAVDSIDSESLDLDTPRAHEEQVGSQGEAVALIAGVARENAERMGDGVTAGDFFQLVITCKPKSIIRDYDLFQFRKLLDLGVRAGTLRTRFAPDRGQLYSALDGIGESGSVT